MSRVIFFIVKNYSDTEWLAKKMLQITEASVNTLNINNQNPIITVSNFQEIKKYKNYADLFVIFAIGNILIDRDHFWNKIYSIPEDIGVLGNIIMHQEDSIPRLDPQCIIVKSELYEYLNDHNFESKGHAILRSAADMHNGYAPEEVFLSYETKNNYYQFGSYLIEQSLLSGYRVRNFDNDWRYGHTNFLTTTQGYPNRSFLYPHKNSKQFEECYKKMKVSNNLDDSQVKFLNAVKQLTKLDILNVWQYEESPYVSQNIKTVISPACGFLGELCAIKNNASTLVLYDINHYNIDFKRRLYTDWNEKDYEEFANDYCIKKNLKKEPLSYNDRIQSESYKQESIKKILNNFREFSQNTKIIILELDLIKEFDKLLKYVTEDSLLLTSTILDEYTFTSLFYDIDDIEYVKSCILSYADKKGLHWHKY